MFSFLKVIGTSAAGCEDVSEARGELVMPTSSEAVGGGWEMPGVGAVVRLSGMVDRGGFGVTGVMGDGGVSTGKDMVWYTSWATVSVVRRSQEYKKTHESE